MDARFIKNPYLRYVEQDEEILLTLFVGAIGSQATQESLAGYFEGFGKVNKVKILIDWVTKQSKECALVYFTSKEAVRKVLDFPQHLIDGKTVRVEPADRTKKGTKIIDASVMLVTNIDYLTLHGEVIEYFSAFGQITSCKFSKDKTRNSKTKSAIIRYEKPNSIDRVLELGSEHLIGGKVVSCCLYKTLPSGDFIYQQQDLFQPRDSMFPNSLDSAQSPLTSTDQFFMNAHLQFGHQSEIHDDRIQVPSIPNQIDIPESPYLVPTELDKNLTELAGLLTHSVEPRARPKPPKYFLFPLEFEKDELFSIYCEFSKPEKLPIVSWDQTPYSKFKSLPKKKNC